MGRTTHFHPSPPSFRGLPGLFGRIARSSRASRRPRNQLLVPMVCARWCGKPGTTTQTTRIMGSAYTGWQHFAGYIVVCPFVLPLSSQPLQTPTFPLHHSTNTCSIRIKVVELRSFHFALQRLQPPALLIDHFRFRYRNKPIELHNTTVFRGQDF